MPPISGAAEVDFGVSNPSCRDLKLLSWGACRCIY